MFVFTCVTNTKDNVSVFVFMRVMKIISLLCASLCSSVQESTKATVCSFAVTRVINTFIVLIFMFMCIPNLKGNCVHL